MDKGDIAILIAALSAAFTFGSFLYTRRLAVNDTKKMKRKELAFEPMITRKPIDDGKRYARILIRNLEPYGATLTKISIRKKGALFHMDPRHHNNSDTQSWVKARNINIRISPSPSNDTALYIVVNNDISPTDIILDWNWLDGTKR